MPAVPGRSAAACDRAARWVVAALFLAAAIGKVTQPELFWRAVRFALAPVVVGRDGLIVLTTALVGAEALLAMLLLLSPRSRWPPALILVLLGALTGFLARLALRGGAPACGCFGFKGSGLSPGQEAMIGLVRNGALAVVSVRLLIVSGGRSRRVPTAVGRPVSTVEKRVARGFTLLELLVVIAVVAVLIGLTLPALRSASRQASGVESLSLHRHHLAAITMYSGDFAGFYPYLNVPGDPLTDPPIGGWESVEDVAYFAVSARFWPTVIYPAYLDGLASRRFRVFAEEEPVFFRRVAGGGPTRPNPWISAFVWMTHTTAAAPAYWDGDIAPENAALLRGMRMSEVTGPSTKGLLLDVTVGAYSSRSPEAERRLISVGMCDGSAGWRGYVIGADGVPPSSVERPGLGAVPFSIMTTRHGVAGRDF